MELGGTSAIVTGGASGLGAATARLLAEHGATVVIADPQADKGEALAKEIDGVFAETDVSNPEQVIAAIDAATGRAFWTFRYRVPPESNAYLMVVKGLAIAGDRLFWATYDGHLIAIDATSGTAIWNKTLLDYKKGLQLNVAPLVIKDKVILGPSTNEYGTNCWIAAYDVRSGAEVWRFKTVPEPGERGNETWPGDSWRHGGAPIWVTGSYDPDTNLTFWGTGNPNPGWNGGPRNPGDNLYSDSVVALDADTGALKWHYQFTPNDEFDWDAVQVPVLADLEWQGRPRKVMLWANRNGHFYVLDRVTGKFLLGKAFVRQNWNLGFDETGRPMRSPRAKPSRFFWQSLATSRWSIARFRSGEGCLRRTASFAGAPAA